MADFLSLATQTESCTNTEFQTLNASDPALNQQFWLATALNSAADAIIIVSAAGRVQFLNRAAERLTGWVQRDAKGRPFSDVLKLEHATVPVIDDLLRLATLNELPLAFHHDLALVTKNGHWIQIEAELAAAVPTHGEPQSSVFTFRDVTDRKWEEHQNRQEHAIRAVERLAETTTHALNNLLTSILGHSELLLNGSGLAASQREAVGIIQSGALDIAGVVRQLSAICRPKFVTRSDIDLNNLIQTLLVSLSNTFLADSSVKLDLDPALCHVNADASELEQVLFALLSNAKEALSAGSGIVVSTYNYVKEAHEGAKSSSTFAAVKVCDTGSGMSRETCERVFEPFFTTKKESGHAGLGLCILQGIVRDNHGFIDVESKIGEGTQVIFGIPAVTPDAFAYLDRTSKSASAVKTVLVVEDDDAVRKLLCKILAGAGYTAVEARNGEDAMLIAHLHEGRIDILLTDLAMPGMSGTDLVRQFAVLHPEARFLLISGFSSNRIGPTTNLPPGTDFLNKPFQQRDLLARLKSLFSEDQQT